MDLPERAFVFLRHGQTEYNREGRFQGQIDVPLNDTGHAQARSVVHALREIPISRIVASPARRVLQTVRPYEEANDLPVHVEDGLMERSVGQFEGQLIESIMDLNQLGPDDSWLSVLPTDAESVQAFVPRVCSAVRLWTEKHPDDLLLIASHGLVFHALAEMLTGDRSFSQNAEAHFFRPENDGWSVSALS